MMFMVKIKVAATLLVVSLSIGTMTGAAVKIIGEKKLADPIERLLHPLSGLRIFK